MLFTSFLVLLSAQLSFAGPWDQALSKCAELLEGPYKKFMESNAQETLLLHTSSILDEEGNPGLFGLSLGKQLGAGFFGQVAVVEQISDHELEHGIRSLNGKQFPGTLVVKIPHTLRTINFGYALPYSNTESKHEFKDYAELNNQVSKFEKDSNFPGNPAWPHGTMPVAPILSAVQTERGLLLFKPLLVGLGLGKIAKLYQKNGNQLPREIEEGLKNHYDFVQAVYKTTGFATDIRPPNFLWLAGDTPEEQKQLEFLGYSRPGFIAFEMARVKGNKPQYIDGKGLSFEEFKKEFVGYLETELKKR